MKAGDVVYYAVFPNGEYTESATWEGLYTNKARCFVLKTYRAIFNYGTHVNYEFINDQHEIVSLVEGKYEVVKFYTTGGSKNFCLRIEFQDRQTGNLYTYDLNSWEDVYQLPIKSVLQFLKEVESYSSFEVYLLTQQLKTLENENRRLFQEVESFKNAKK